MLSHKEFAALLALTAAFVGGTSLASDKFAIVERALQKQAYAREHLLSREEMKALKNLLAAIHSRNTEGMV